MTLPIFIENDNIVFLHNKCKYFGLIFTYFNTVGLPRLFNMINQMLQQSNTRSSPSSELSNLINNIF